MNLSSGGLIYLRAFIVESFSGSKFVLFVRFRGSLTKFFISVRTIGTMEIIRIASKKIASSFCFSYCIKHSV